MKSLTKTKGTVKSYKFTKNHDVNLIRFAVKTIKDKKASQYLKGWCKKLLDNILNSKSMVYDSHNLVVNQGLAIYPILMQNQTLPTLSIAIGTGNTAAAVTQTNLVNQVAEDVSPSASATLTDCVVYAVIGPGWAGTFYEFGLYVGGYMHSRTVDSVGNTKDAAETIVIQWTLSYARG